MSNAGDGVVAIAVTRAGCAIARRLGSKLPGLRIQVPARFAEAGEESHDRGTGAAIETWFPRSEALILVMAAGIAVRMIARLLGDKRSDPAVVVVDDGGRFAISLLSGHLGGANQLAEQIASALGGTAVITTASEAAGLPALDLVAQTQGWRIDSESELTAVSAALVNGDQVGVFQECGSRAWLPVPLPANLVVYPSVAALNAALPAAAIVVSDRSAVTVAAGVPVLIYRPPTLALGVGTSRGAPEEELCGLAMLALRTGNFAAASIGVVATIDLKRNEPAVVALAAQLNVALVTYTTTELDDVPGSWCRSEVVRRAVGTGGVCEPAALLASGAPSLAVSKQKSAHATIAIARVAGGIPAARVATNTAVDACNDC